MVIWYNTENCKEHITTVYKLKYAANFLYSSFTCCWSCWYQVELEEAARGAARWPVFHCYDQEYDCLEQGNYPQPQADPVCSVADKEILHSPQDNWLCKKRNKDNINFEIFNAETFQIVVFCTVTLCSPVGRPQYFGGAYHLLLFRSLFL